MADQTAEAPTERRASSFAKSLFLGEIHEDLVFPYPYPEATESRRVRELVASLGEFAEGYDEREVEERRWIPDEALGELGERGLMGLWVSEEYGGQGLSQTGYCRVFEAIGKIDATLAVVLGVHQSIGYKGIALYGTDEQQERFLPDLAAGRKLAGFALTEPQAGSDAYNLQTRAVRQLDGSWTLNGEKRWIGNGSRADVLTVFARAEVDGRDRHIALLVEKGMEGFEVGERYDTMGLRANDLRRLRFNDVRVPQENVLGEPGDGFRIAMAVLNNGRMSLGTGSVGAAKFLVDRMIDHTTSREQFGGPIADLELVRDKVGWLVSYLFGLEAMSYLTTGLVDRGIEDYSLESAICKIAGTEFIWYAANRALQLAGGEGYMRDQPYEKVLRDIRIFPIFEGANDVLRSYVALTGLKPLGERLSELGRIGLDDPIGSLGVLADYVARRVTREVVPERINRAHPELDDLAASVSGQVKRLAGTSESLLREHRDGIVGQGLHHKRLSDAVSDVYGQIATISRVTALFEDQGSELSGQERYIAETFCHRAGNRVARDLDQVEDNDDERMLAIADLAYRRGGYGYGLCSDD